MPDLIPTIIPSVETSSKNENESITELAPTPAPAETPAATTPQKQLENALNTTATPKVINKTKEPEILHAVDPKADALTTIADKEEEAFIKEVLKEHQDADK